MICFKGEECLEISTPMTYFLHFSEIKVIKIMNFNLISQDLALCLEEGVWEDLIICLLECKEEGEEEEGKEDREDFQEECSFKIWEDKEWVDSPICHRCLQICSNNNKKDEPDRKSVV